jgi:hypothetical protein
MSKEKNAPSPQSTPVPSPMAPSEAIWTVLIENPGSRIGYGRVMLYVVSTMFAGALSRLPATVVIAHVGAAVVVVVVVVLVLVLSTVVNGVGAVSGTVLVTAPVATLEQTDERRLVASPQNLVGVGTFRSLRRAVRF